MLDFVQVAGFAGEASGGILVILAWTEKVNLMFSHKSATYLNRITCVSKNDVSVESIALRCCVVEKWKPTHPSDELNLADLSDFWGHGTKCIEQFTRNPAKIKAR